jgi:hypothetical protein
MALTDISAATARTQWARGLTTDLIVRAIEQQPKGNIIAQAMTAKTGRNLIGLKRAAKRISRHPACIYARAIKSDKNIFLEVIVRGGGRDAQMRYIDKKDAFIQDQVRYFFRQIQIKGTLTEDSIVVLTRHTLQRWIERGGAGDPREALLEKLDKAMAYAFGERQLISAASEIFAESLHDNQAQSSRFGVPDTVGGMWIAGLSGFDAQSHFSTLRRQYRSLITFLTYLSREQLSESQAEYLELANERGIFAATRDFPDLFRPRGIA